MRSVVVGQYVPGNSVLHRLQATTKLLATLAYTVALFATGSWPAQALLAAFVVVLVPFSRLPVAAVWRGVRSILGLVALTFLLDAFATPGTPIWRMGPLVLSRAGLVFGGQMCLRLLLLVVVGALLTLTTNPIDLTDGIESLLRPLRRLGVPAHELAMMMTIALRFIPTLLEEAQRIVRAQTARGADFDSGSPAARLRALTPLLVPLLVSALRRAEELAVAMEARCYRGGEGRSRWHEHRLRPADGAAATVVVALIAATAWLQWHGI